MTRNDKNCTVGRKIELWSHCAPPKIVKNRQKMTKVAQWDGKLLELLVPLCTAKNCQKVTKIAQWDGKLNFGPTVHRQKLSKIAKK